MSYITYFHGEQLKKKHICMHIVKVIYTNIANKRKLQILSKDNAKHIKVRVI